MLEAPNMFPDDPDAQQAFTDALPIIAELLNASARVPANSQAGRQMRATEQLRAVQQQVQDLTEQVALKAQRCGVDLNELIERGTAVVKRQARGIGASELGRVVVPVAANAEHGGRALRERYAAAEQKVSEAVRAVSAAAVTLQQRRDARNVAMRERDIVKAEMLAYEQGRVAA